MEIRLVQIPGHPMYYIAEDGRLYSEYLNKFLNPKALRNGYIRCGLLTQSSPVKKYKYYSVHQLVLLAFVGPCPEGMEACHKDGNRLNNQLSNLEYKSHQDNMNDQYQHGTRFSQKRGKLSQEDADKIRELRPSYKVKELAAIFKVSQRQVERVLNGTRWK